MQQSRDFHILTSHPRRPRPWRNACLGLLILAGAAACGAGQRPERVDSVALSRANALLDDLVRTELSLTPESVSRHGLDRYGDPSWPRRLNDASQAGFERARLIRLGQLLIKVV